MAKIQFSRRIQSKSGLSFICGMLVGIVVHVVLSYFQIIGAPLVSSLMAAIVSLGIVLAHSNQEEKTRMFESASEFFKENAYSVLKYGCLSAVVFCALNDSTEPTQEHVIQISNLINTFTMIGLVIIPISVALSLLRREARQNFSISSFLNSLVMFVALLTITQWFLGRYGDSALQFIVENPAEFATTVFAVFISWKIVTLSFHKSISWDRTVAVEYQNSALAPTGAMSSLINRRKMTEQDLDYAIAHEASHAILYVAWGSLPEEFKIVVKGSQSFTSQGYVTQMQSNHLLSMKAYCELDMLVYLAGQYGENFIMGGNTLGAESDHRKWLSVAGNYLSNHFDGIYYSNPATDLELAHNHKALEELKAEQMKVLDRFFSENELALRELMALLRDKMELNRDDVVEPFNKVRITEGIPLPLGNFEKFTTDWPDNAGLYMVNESSN